MPPVTSAERQARWDYQMALLDRPSSFPRHGQAPHIRPEDAQRYPDTPAVRAAMKQALDAGWNGKEPGEARDIGQRLTNAAGERYPSWRIVDIAATPEPDWPTPEPVESEPPMVESETQAPPEPAEPETSEEATPPLSTELAKPGKGEPHERQARCKGCLVEFTSHYYSSSGWALYHSRSCAMTHFRPSEPEPAPKPLPQPGPASKALAKNVLTALAQAGSQEFVSYTGEPSPSTASTASTASSRHHVVTALHALVDALPSGALTTTYGNDWLAAQAALLTLLGHYPEQRA